MPARQKEINQLKGTEEELEAAELVSSDEEEEKKEEAPIGVEKLDEDLTDEEKEEGKEKSKKLKIKK